MTVFERQTSLNMDNGFTGEGGELKTDDNSPVFTGYSSGHSISRLSIPGIYRSPFSGRDNQAGDGELR
jgi:hypothetical protein